uniref:Arginine biosynthesis bifunctional protein ArgJ, chloroplastic n=1 Tax=Micromonas pusilla TaxID=38833 RepID=A0A7S0KIV9_MICPS|mmetsp:Transcript_13860/g.54950  ORF Transcript_13860/g.54950 Transcript_13860/m.54950 type:complete len:496 (+) Transcript_13860:355-1842(+)
MHAHTAVRSVPTQFATARRVTDATKKRGVERSVVPLRRANVVVLRASADAKPPAVDYKSDEFTIPDAPIKDLVPTGAWKVIDGGVCAPKGFKAAAFKAKLRKSGKNQADCCLIVADKPAVVGGVFTKNRVAAAPVQYCREVLAKPDKRTVRAVLANAGQANAATGVLGMEDAVRSAATVAEALGCDADDVLLQSTGVIGKRIKMDELAGAVPTLAGNLKSTKEAAYAAATAICTTDLVRKTLAVEVDLGGGGLLGGRKARVGGMGKGSGMIHPNMATMLGVVTCDANVEPECWSAMVKRAAKNSFNQISVDGDTSTNDCVIGLASGAAGGDAIVAGSPEAEKLEAALTAVCVGIAKSIAWDGEGATCLIECNVKGAQSLEDARVIARSVVSSSLAKSAIFGHDPNWGRLACAAGYSGVHFEQEDLRIQLGPHLLMENGQPLAYDAVEASAYLKDTTAVHGTVVVDVGVGDGAFEGSAWGCDLTYDYVKINAEYTT